VEKEEEKAEEEENVEEQEEKEEKEEHPDILACRRCGLVELTLTCRR
jgi:hypothetical protein